MNQENTTQWLSAHLYYSDPIEDFLSEAVTPFIRTAISTGIASQYFFIRYKERGPHIRLRLKAAPNSIEDLLKPNLEEHFNSYFLLHPSKRTDPRYPEGFPDQHKWLPNNSIQFVPYQAETKRYGGPSGLSISENHFQLSSEASLYYIQEKRKEWSYYEALGIGIKLHLSFAHSLGMNSHETLAFFKFLFYNWLPTSARAIEFSRAKGHELEKEEATINAFSKAWEDQKNVLKPFHQALWEALCLRGEFEDPMLNQWIDGTRKLKATLMNALSEDLLKLPSYKESSDRSSATYFKNRKFWPLFSSYIHMTNNRLGIFNHDEGFLAYLMMKGIGELSH